jgi:hypothetical protein
MPFSYLLEKEHGKWKEFRKVLTKENQEAFDRIFDRAKFHTAAAVYMSHPMPLETILLSILLEHEKMLGEIQRMLKERDAQAKQESEQPLRLLWMQPIGNLLSDQGGVATSAVIDDEIDLAPVL